MNDDNNNNGSFKVRSWKDILTLVSIMGVATAVGSWLWQMNERSSHAAQDVVELRARQDDVRQRLLLTEERLRALLVDATSLDTRLQEVERVHAAGIMPRADERLIVLEREIAELRRRVNAAQ